ncbi:MAG: PDZ domain-containing protein [Chloroflexi bacterium]|nr:MAG: PDZ domain-containing protein [Chloroflexota bacterium]MBL1193430.1 RIP metalloprotease [Chloroflexota bacterium]NOH10722.1 site-2 protease family protein [Chloroflexota bacterium]
MDGTLLILGFVATLVVLIVIHELGHFLAARLLGVEVDEFGIGFPPRMLTLFKWRGTIFSLNWIPLGGFVRPKGENDPNVEGGLAAASPWVRLVVLLAGPFANFLTAILVFAIIFYQVGDPKGTVEILEVNANSPAEASGLQEGDIIFSIDGQTVERMRDLSGVVGENLGETIPLEYERGDEIFPTTLVPRVAPPPGEGAIGIVMTLNVLATDPITWPEAALMGGTAVAGQSYAILRLPFEVARGSVAPEDARLVGLKGMSDMYAEVVERDRAADAPGFGLNVLSFVGAISVSLGLLNLMPIPALDGGRILFTLPEIIIRRRIPQEFENTVNLIGFVLLIMLMIYVNLQDFINPVQIP